MSRNRHFTHMFYKYNKNEPLKNPKHLHITLTFGIDHLYYLYNIIWVTVYLLKILQKNYKRLKNAMMK